MTDAPPILLLVPTPLERGGLGLEGPSPWPGVRVETVGFGPVVAAARATELLALHAPRHVVLAGIAGSYGGARAPLGAVLRFGSVALDGVGAGEGEEFVGPEDLGFGESRIFRLEGDAERHHLLTVCACATDGATAARRRRRHHPVAEDMEGWGVALACERVAVPLTVLRGISNEVAAPRGDWDVPAALGALRGALEAHFGGTP